MDLNLDESFNKYFFQNLLSEFLLNREFLIKEMTYEPMLLEYLPLELREN